MESLRGLPKAENGEEMREPFTAPAETEGEFDALEEKLADPNYKQRMVSLQALAL